MFVHGCFWHGHSCARGASPTTNAGFWLSKISGNRKRDNRARKRLRQDGWKVLTIWECETKNRDRLERRLAQFLKQPRSEPEKKEKASPRWRTS